MKQDDKAKGGWNNFLTLDLLVPGSNETKCADVLVGRRNLVGLLFSVRLCTHVRYFLTNNTTVVSGKRERSLPGF